MLWIRHKLIRQAFEVDREAEACGEKGRESEQKRGHFEEEADGKKLR